MPPKRCPTLPWRIANDFTCCMTTTTLVLARAVLNAAKCHSNSSSAGWYLVADLRLVAWLRKNTHLYMVYLLVHITFYPDIQNHCAASARWFDGMLTLGLSIRGVCDVYLPENIQLSDHLDIEDLAAIRKAMIVAGFQLLCGDESRICGEIMRFPAFDRITSLPEPCATSIADLGRTVSIHIIILELRTNMSISSIVIGTNASRFCKACPHQQLSGGNR